MKIQIDRTTPIGSFLALLGVKSIINSSAKTPKLDEIETGEVRAYDPARGLFVPFPET